MESKIVGLIEPLKHDPDFFESKPYPIPYFDNKELKIGFIDAKYEPYLLGADNALQNFLKLNFQNRIENSELVYNNYEEILRYGYTEDLEIKNTIDIWKFIYPSEIIIYGDEDEDFYLCVSCECDWEEEHGLQLVFKNGEKLTRASGHDGHFTDD